MTARRKLRIALLALACFHGFVLFAGFFAPYEFSAQDREHPFAPPTRLHFVDAQRKIHLRPFVYGSECAPDARAGCASDDLTIYPVHFLVRGAPYNIAGLFPARLRLFGVQEPGRVFLIGTDDYGRDQFSRFLYGGQISLLAGLLAAILSVSLGAVIGALAGFYGGWVDEALMRVAELFLASPWLYLLFAVRAALPLHVAEWQIFMLLISVLGLLGWARPAGSRHRTEREGAKLRLSGTGIWSDRHAHPAASRIAPNLRRPSDPSSAPDSSLRPRGGHTELPWAGRWGASAQLG